MAGTQSVRGGILSTGMGGGWLGGGEGIPNEVRSSAS